MSTKRESFITNKVSEICFPVEKREYEGFANSGCTHDIYATVNGTELRLASVADRYKLVPNDQIFPQIESELRKNGVDFSVSYEVVNYAQTTAKFSLHSMNGKSLSFLIHQGKDEDGNVKRDEIFPQLTMRHSYDGSLKYAFMFGYYRLVCENGLVIPVEEKSEHNFEVIGKHTEKLQTESLANLHETLEKFLAAQNDFLPKFETLVSNTYVKNFADRVEEVMNATKISTGRDSKEDGKGKAKLGRVIEIAQKESKNLDMPMNDWLIYNAINNFLYDNEENIKNDEVRRNSDKAVLDYMLNKKAKTKVTA